MLERLRGFKFLLNVHINRNVGNRIWFELHNRNDHNEFRQLIVKKNQLDVLFKYGKINFSSLWNSCEILFLGPEKFWSNLFLSLDIKEVHSMSFLRFIQIPIFLKKINIKSFEYQHGLINYRHLKYCWDNRWDNVDVVYVEDLILAKYLSFNNINFKYLDIVNQYVKCGLKESKLKILVENIIFKGGYWVESDCFSNSNEEKILSFIQKHSLLVLKHPKNVKNKNIQTPLINKSKNVFGYFSSKMLKLSADGYNVIQVKLSENDKFYQRIYELPEINLNKK